MDPTGPRSPARIALDIQDACYRLADGLGGPADASAAARAARDIGHLFGELAAQSVTRALPDELVIDDDGPRAGILRPVEPTDYVSGWRTHGARGEDPRSWQ